MIRIAPLVGAAVFAFATLVIGPVAADAGQTRANEASYAAVLRSINPQLPEARARAYARSIMADAWRTHLDPRFIMSIVTVESRWHADAVSRVGARGLGQLMPRTAQTLGVNAWNPSENLRGTSTYLSTLLTHFSGHKNGIELAIAGYNAGPKAVEKFGGIPPYAETQNYVVRVLGVFRSLKSRIGRAFAPHTVIAAKPTPDERAWVTSTDSVLPAVAIAPAAAVMRERPAADVPDP
jgi:soluble lytic murein transglycosylase-like protein